MTYCQTGLVFAPFYLFKSHHRCLCSLTSQQFLPYQGQYASKYSFVLGRHGGGSRILCLGGLMERVFLFGGLMGIRCRRRETAIAEGKKSLTTRGSGPQKPTQF